MLLILDWRRGVDFGIDFDASIGCGLECVHVDTEEFLLENVLEESSQLQIFL